MLFSKTAFGLLLLGFLSHASGESLGAYGPVYHIAEPDLLEQIRDRLKQKEASGELASLQKEAIARSMNSIEHPSPVKGIGRTTKARTFYYDPSYVQKTSVFDQEGRLIVPAGTKVNPMDMVNLSKNLIFIDAREKKQVAFAKRAMEQYEGHVKTILVAGSWVDLMKSWKVQVFYDQGGLLTGKFGITQTPAVVSQEGKRLRIDEIKL